jgi:putative nucleotidyltransferase with HDIG domain
MEDDLIIKWNKIIENTAPLPAIVSMLLERIDDPKSSVKDMEILVEKDPILASKILRMANSAYYGYPKTIASIGEAIIILGTNVIRSICLAVVTKSIMNVDSSGYFFTKSKGLWEHSVLVASGARTISKILKLDDPERYFVGGLLHDIGKIVLSHEVKPYRLQILKYLLFKDVTISEIEKEIIGISHNVVGEMLASYWNLPKFISNVIRYHDNPYEAPKETFRDVLIISCANELSYNFISDELKEFGLSSRRMIFADRYLGELGISNERENILESMAKSIEIFSEV